MTAVHDRRVDADAASDGELGRSLIELEDLTKLYPIAHEKAVVSAVNGVSLSIKPGETLGLVGESGSGKTTVARCILSLTDITSGRIVFDGVDIAQTSRRQARELRRRIQLVFQEPFDSLNSRMRIESIIEEPLSIARVSKDQRAQRVKELLDLVHLPQSILDLYPHELSGGLQQRVGIARALANEPALVVLDEPTSALDPRARRQILDLLRELQARTGVAYLFITHDLNTLRRIAHRIAVMYLGVVVEEGTTEEIFEQQRHPYTRALLSSVLYPNPDTRRERFELEGEIPSPINLPAGCYLASRCPLAIEACRTSRPPLVPIGPAHTSACIRHELVPTAPATSAPD